MLPSERSERWAWRIGIAVLAILALFIAVWIYRFVSRRAAAYLKSRDIPTEEGRISGASFQLASSAAAARSLAGSHSAGIT